MQRKTKESILIDQNNNRHSERVLCISRYGTLLEQPRQTEIQGPPQGEPGTQIPQRRKLPSQKGLQSNSKWSPQKTLQTDIILQHYPQLETGYLIFRPCKIPVES